MALHLGGAPDWSGYGNENPEKYYPDDLSYKPSPESLVNMESGNLFWYPTFFLDGQHMIMRDDGRARKWYENADGENDGQLRQELPLIESQPGENKRGYWGLRDK